MEHYRTRICAAASNRGSTAVRGEDVKLTEEQSAVLSAFSQQPTEENLWRCVAAFQGMPFRTASGLPFTYTLGIGRNGSYTRELWVDRREQSKSLAWSSVRLAFQRALEKPNVEFDRPKALADVRGISYSFPLLWRFGLVQVSESLARKMEIE